MMTTKKLTAAPEKPETRHLTTEEAVKFFDMILTQWVLLDQLDNLSYTSFYRHKIKMLAKQLVIELERSICARHADIYGIQDEAFHNLLQHKKEVIRKISVLKPELQAGFNELLSEYLNAPELVMHRNGIRITEN